MNFRCEKSAALSKNKLQNRTVATKAGISA